jgi:enoyl-CoA hydratase/carnithine racemase
LPLVSPLFSNTNTNTNSQSLSLISSISPTPPTRKKNGTQNAMASAPSPPFTRLRIVTDPPDGVGRLTLSRPSKSNAFDAAAWDELHRAVSQLADACRRRGGGRVRCVLLDAEGPNFCAGLDLRLLRETMARLDGGGNHSDEPNDDDPAGRRERFFGEIQAMQAAITALETALPVPVVAAVAGACVGAGVDLIAAADVRLCSADAVFCVKEVDLAIAADLGSLQRLPALVGLGAASEWALTARRVPAVEAEAKGLVARVCEDREALAEEALKMARLLASKPPRALAGTKRALLRARDRPCVAEGLEAIARENMSALSGSGELRRAAQGAGGRSRL